MQDRFGASISLKLFSRQLVGKHLDLISQALFFDNHSLRAADRRQIDCTAPPFGVADHVDRRGRIVTSTQARTVKHHKRLAVERQVGARQPGKTNALCEKRF